MENTQLITIIDSEFGAFAKINREINTDDITIERVEAHHYDSSVGDKDYSKAYAYASIGGLDNILAALPKQSFYDRTARNEINILIRIQPIKNGPSLHQRKMEATFKLRKEIDEPGSEHMQKIVNAANKKMQDLVTEFNTRATDNVLHTIKRGSSAFDDDEFQIERKEIDALRQQQREINAKLTAAKDNLFIKTRAEIIKYIKKEGLDQFLDVGALGKVERPSSPFDL